MPEHDDAPGRQQKRLRKEDLDRLPPRSRRLWLLRALGFTRAEVARLLDLTEADVDAEYARLKRFPIGDE